MCMKNVGVIKDVLNKLSLKDFYSVIAAIRGPDYTNLWLLKHIFTARIRYILFGKDIPGATRETPYLLLLDIKNALYDVIYYSQVSNVAYNVLLHYIGHILNGLHALAKYFEFRDKKIFSELNKLWNLCNEIADLIHGVYEQKIKQYFEVARELLKTEKEKKALDEIKERLLKFFKEKGKPVLDTEEEIEEFLHELEVVYADATLDEE